MKNIYLSFMGKKDPFRSCRISIPGPNLSFLTEKKCFYDKCIFLVHDELRENIIPMMDLCSDMVYSDGFGFSTFNFSPVDINSIFNFLQSEIKQIIEEEGPDTVIHANISPGTPQMQSCFMLAAMCCPQLKLYQIIDPKFKAAKRITEVKLPEIKIAAGKENVEKNKSESSEITDLEWIAELRAQVSKICIEAGKMPEIETDSTTEQSGINLPLLLQNVEKNIIAKVIKQFPNLSDAARFVGIKPNSFRKKVSEQWKLRKRKKNDINNEE
jgi:hypothetical protein